MNGARVEAVDLSLKGPQGWVFREISVKADPGELVCLAGPSGSGRTSLLLTLAGRMRPGEGSVRIDGETRPRRLHTLAALAVLPGVNDLEPRLTVTEHAKERLTGQGWLHPRTKRARIEEALAAVGLDLEPRTPTDALHPVQLTLFGVALALLDRPRVIMVDDVGRGITADRLAEVWEPLRALDHTVIAACVDPPPHAHRVVDLPLERG
ncbi:ATP-binding cassette domain-containing protein [Nonomuraea typhae]|uniref:ATP-binding cassette domain-containing protein n=1 Tax=Nonomuraea typhae TaxID=2603600 RepID=A0ABW7ZA99_9ACTN